MAHGEESQADLAYRIAETTAENVGEIAAIGPAEASRAMDLAIRIAVLLAFGCSCTPGQRMDIATGGTFAPRFFEDITCKLHGTGPIVPEAQFPDRRPEPGA